MKLATLLYVRDQDKTLMLHRIKKANDVHEGKWNGLGGKFEPGETPEACARRELNEESGLIAEKMTLKGFLTFPLFAKNEDWYVFVFLVTAFSGTLTTSNEGELAWIENERLLQLPLWEGDRIFLPYLDTPGIFSGSFTYQNGKLTAHHLQCYP